MGGDDNWACYQHAPFLHLTQNGLYMCIYHQLRIVWTLILMDNSHKTPHLAWQSSRVYRVQYTEHIITTIFHINDAMVVRNTMAPPNQFCPEATAYLHTLKNTHSMWRQT